MFKQKTDACPSFLLSKLHDGGQIINNKLSYKSEVLMLLVINV
jgi:hypothetical protein